MKTTLMATLVLSLTLPGGAALAAVAPEQAAQLKTTLTPFGAEKAGNKTGEIPPWTGGMTYDPSQANNKFAPDLHAADKKVLTINAGNVDQYAARLAPSVIYMLKNFPGYRLDIYPTHRDAVATAWAYDQMYANATRATMQDHFPVNAYGGVPFPIPKTGEEVAWNANYAWRGLSTQNMNATYIVPAGGSPIQTSRNMGNRQYEIYNPDGDNKSWNGLVFQTRSQYQGPPARAGEELVAWEAGTIGKLPRSVWQYLVGQRRLRKAPNIQFDGVYPDCSGFAGSDEIEVWNGETSRYDMKLVGKKEMYIPYDNNKQFHASVAEIDQPHYLNPDLVRWELHRVWVVDMTVAPGARHVIPHRVVYFDEDTWSVMLADEYNSQGELYRSNQGFTYSQPGIPAIWAEPNVIYDLHGGGYCNLISYYFKDGISGFVVMKPRPFSFFQPETIAAEAAR